MSTSISRDRPPSWHQIWPQFSATALSARVSYCIFNAIGIPSRPGPFIEPYNIGLVYSPSFSNSSCHNDLQNLPHNDAVPIQPAASDPDGFSMRTPAASGSQPIPLIQQWQQPSCGCYSFSSLPPPTHGWRPHNPVRHLLRYPRRFSASEHPRRRPH